VLHKYETKEQLALQITEVDEHGQGSQPLWHAKDGFPDVRKRVGSLRAVRETKKS
jgi:hypothetical protein